MTTNHVRIFDTTLRDGEQSPGATMTLDEKLRIARKLEELGVDVIEAGFPAASLGEQDAVRQIAESVSSPEVAGLCRTRDKDIEAAWAALGTAKHPRLHVFIATSDLHLQYKLKMTREQVLREIQRGVSHCKSLCPSVEFSAEDATRTDLGFLREAIACAIDAGATTVNIPDTVGYTMPEEYRTIIGAMIDVVGGRDVVVSAHCHDDLGLAVANSLAAISAGARQVECTINGIGERAGNAAMEEIVMALKVREDLLRCRTQINTRHFMQASRMVSDATGMTVQPNKAIVGKNAFAHESGIHQHGMLKEKRTYEIMRPEDVGVTESSLILGKHSGRHALADRLKSLGHVLSAEQFERVFDGFKLLADKKKRIYDEDLHVLVAGDRREPSAELELTSIEFRGGSATKPFAEVVVTVRGVQKTGEGVGDGPVAAAFEAIKASVGRPNILLRQYQLAAITDGSDAQGKVTLTVSEGSATARGQAAHTDIVIASAQAFLHAINQLGHQREHRPHSDSPSASHEPPAEDLANSRRSALGMG